MARKVPKRVSALRAKTPAADELYANGLRLWAPWRYQYIRSAAAKQDSCIFCFGKIDEAERKRRLVLHVEEHAVVMLNRYPYNNGHLMVAPRRHVASPELLSREERGFITDCCVQLRKALKPSGINLGANLGRSAGAGIADHMHWHIVPRWDGDTNFMPVLASTRVLSQHLESSLEMLAPLFKTIEPP